MVSAAEGGPVSPSRWQRRWGICNVCFLDVQWKIDSRFDSRGGFYTHKKPAEKLLLPRLRRSHGVDLNQIQAALSEESSSSLLHRAHIKGGIINTKVGSSFNPLQQVHQRWYGNAANASMNVSLLLQPIKHLFVLKCSRFIFYFAFSFCHRSQTPWYTKKVNFNCLFESIKCIN